MKQIKTAQEFCDAFLATFPDKPATEVHNETKVWMKVVDGVPTTGESCYIEGLCAVEYYDDWEPTYQFSILKKVCDFAEQHGWFAELYDPGTVKFFKI